MDMQEIILFAFVLSVSLAAFIISCFQFKEKGFLFNNTYIYASKKERETMNRKPYYRQSAISFLLIGMAFFLLAIDIAFTVQWLSLAVLLLLISMTVYAFVSSINIEKDK